MKWTSTIQKSTGTTKSKADDDDDHNDSFGLVTYTDKQSFPPAVLCSALSYSSTSAVVVLSLTVWCVVKVKEELCMYVLQCSSQPACCDL